MPSRLRSYVSLGAAAVLGAAGATLLIPDAPVHAADEAAGVKATPQAASPTTDELSYTLGYVISHRLAAMNVELDVPAFADGFKTARSDAELKVSEERMQEVLDAFSMQRDIEVKSDGEKAKPAASGADQRTAEEKRRAMAEQMQQRPINRDPGTGGYLELGGQVPKGRVNAAVETTQRVTREADAPDARE